MFNSKYLQKKLRELENRKQELEKMKYNCDVAEELTIIKMQINIIKNKGC